jgi:hypothetical protein
MGGKWETGFGVMLNWCGFWGVFENLTFRACQRDSFFQAELKVWTGFFKGVKRHGGGGYG